MNIENHIYNAKTCLETCQRSCEPRSPSLQISQTINHQQLSAILLPDIPHEGFVVFSQFTLVARDKKLRYVLPLQLLKTDIVIAVISQTEATKGFDTPFWQRINSKILQLQQEGKLCQQPPKP